MHNSNMMPGSFPGSSRDAQGIRVSPNTEIDESMVDQQRCKEFVRNESSGLKTQLQRHMVGQLDALAFILIMYSLIRYTYFSCYIAALIDCSVQVLLHAGNFANGEGNRIFETLRALSEDMASRPDSPVSPNKIIDFVVQNTKYLVFLKTALTMSYHITNHVFWLRPMVIAGKADLLEHGPLFFMSFLGEAIPRDITEDCPWWVQLWRLGLMELLVLDVMVLLIQLVLYQSIYRQSTISPRGLKLDEQEIYILRAKGTSGNPEDPGNGVPDILHVKLYETLWGETARRQE